MELRRSMISQRNNSPRTVSISESYKGQYFLLNFIMGTYLGPDVYSDNPRRSAAQRLAEGLPPYSSKSLGFSFISISYLVVKPSVLHMYLKGDLPLPSSDLFPMNIHGHKRYSGHFDIVKGIVLIDDPITSYMKKEDLERFRCLSGMSTLKIDRIESLCYQHGKGQEEGEQNCMKNSEMAAGNISNGNENSSAGFQETYKRTPYRDPLPVPTFPNVSYASNNHSGEGVFQKTCIRDGPVVMPLLTVSSFFRVALPGVRRDCCQFSCEIESDGKLHIQGSTPGEKTIRKCLRVFLMKFQQLCPPGPFTVSFSLPGPVDPGLFSPNFRSDGIFEGVVIKHK
ncbi:hypothetical protein ACOSQ4_011466 [Xanthoceras sorbifolium]